MSSNKPKGGAEKARLKNKRLRDREASTCQNLGSMFNNIAESQSSSKKSKADEEVSKITEHQSDLQVNLMPMML